MCCVCVRVQTKSILVTWFPFQKISFLLLQYEGDNGKDFGIYTPKCQGIETVHGGMCGVGNLWQFKIGFRSVFVAAVRII